MASVKIPVCARCSSYLSARPVTQRRFEITGEVPIIASNCGHLYHTHCYETQKESIGKCRIISCELPLRPEQCIPIKVRNLEFEFPTPTFDIQEAETEKSLIENLKEILRRKNDLIEMNDRRLREQEETISRAYQLEIRSHYTRCSKVTEKDKVLENTRGAEGLAATELTQLR